MRVCTNESLFLFLPSRSREEEYHRVFALADVLPSPSSSTRATSRADRNGGNQRTNRFCWQMRIPFVELSRTGGRRPLPLINSHHRRVGEEHAFKRMNRRGLERRERVRITRNPERSDRTSGREREENISAIVRDLFPMGTRGFRAILRAGGFSNSRAEMPFSLVILVHSSRR